MDTNETIELDDLALTEGQEEAVKGGVSHTAGRCSCGQEHPYGGGGFINNHNETIASDEDTPLADLESQGEVKGGVMDGVRDLLIFNANGTVSQR